MADSKISQLSSASALAGTEVAPVVQSGSTKKATVNQILSPAVGNGVNFSANTPLAGATSQLLDFYEEGTWTPDLQFNGAKVGMTYGDRNGYYTRVGRLITVTARIRLTAKGSSTGTAYLAGLPYATELINSYMDRIFPVSIALGTLFTSPSAAKIDSSDALIFYTGGSGTGRAIATDTNFTDSTYLTVWGCYETV